MTAAVQRAVPCRLSVRSYLYCRGRSPRSKAKSNRCRSSATPSTTSVSPRRVPRQPRGPAPKGSQQKLEGAPPRPGSSIHLVRARARARARARDRARARVRIRVRVRAKVRAGVGDPPLGRKGVGELLRRALGAAG